MSSKSNFDSVLAFISQYKIYISIILAPSLSFVAYRLSQWYLFNRERSLAFEREQLLKEVLNEQVARSDSSLSNGRHKKNQKPRSTKHQQPQVDIDAKKEAEQDVEATSAAEDETPSQAENPFKPTLPATGESDQGMPGSIAFTPLKAPEVREKSFSEALTLPEVMDKSFSEALASPGESSKPDPAWSRVPTKNEELIASLRTKNEQLDASVATLESRLRTLDRETSSLLETKTELQQKVSLLSKQNMDLTHDFASYKVQAGSVLQKANILEQRLKSYDQACEQVSTLKAELESVKATLHHSSDNELKHMSTITELRLKISNLEQNSHALNDELMQSNENYENQARVNANLTQELAEKQSIVDAFDAVQERLSKSERALNDHKAQIQSINSSAEGKIQALQADLGKEVERNKLLEEKIASYEQAKEAEASNAATSEAKSGVAETAANAECATNCCETASDADASQKVCKSNEELITRLRAEIEQCNMDINEWKAKNISSLSKLVEERKRANLLEKQAAEQKGPLNAATN